MESGMVGAGLAGSTVGVGVGEWSLYCSHGAGRLLHCLGGECRRVWLGPWGGRGWCGLCGWGCMCLIRGSCGGRPIVGGSAGGGGGRIGSGL